MKNKELYDKTVSILVDAYFNDTLEHRNCFACAVGNIVASNLGYKFVPCEDKEDPIHTMVWDIVKSRKYYGYMGVTWYSARSYGEVKEQIDATGYSYKELWKIEQSFERADKGVSEDEYMFNGLMAVIEQLDKIHENKDTTLTTQTKKRFHKNECQIS